MAGPWALATAALYLVLLSNGLPYPKIRLKKFGFSSKSVPANIAQKLPSQRCSKPLFIAFFSFSHKHPTFAFASESGYTLAFANRIAHKGTQGETGAFPPPATARLCAASDIFLFRHAFIYIHFPVLCEPSLSATALSQTTSRRVFQLRSQTAYVCFHVRKRVHARLCSKNRTQGHTRRNRGVSDGEWYHYPRSVPHVHKHPRAGYQNGALCRFWVLAGGTPEERRKPSGQRCAYARRCSEAPQPAGLCDLVLISSFRGTFHFCLQLHSIS